MATDRPIHCNVRNPVLLNIADAKTEFHSGCRVIDITFPNITNPEVKCSFFSLVLIVDPDYKFTSLWC